MYALLINNKLNATGTRAQMLAKVNWYRQNTNNKNWQIKNLGNI
jgi:hypothetical protein